MRNTKKQAEQGRQIIKKRPLIDLSAGELMQFRDYFKGVELDQRTVSKVYDVICDAFYMGLAVGYRNK